MTQITSMELQRSKGKIISQKPSVRIERKARNPKY